MRHTKLVGSEYEMDRKTGALLSLQRFPFVEFEGIPNNNRHTGLSTDRLEDSEPPHKRRKVQTVVRKAVQTILQKARDFREPQQSQEKDSRTNRRDESFDRYDSLPLCPRFNEISTYLINNRRRLALHKMCFVMPEHTLVRNNSRLKH